MRRVAKTAPAKQTLAWGKFGSSCLVFLCICIASTLVMVLSGSWSNFTQFYVLNVV